MLTVLCLIVLTISRPMGETRSGNPLADSVAVIRTVGAIVGDTISFYHKRVTWRVDVLEVEWVELRNTARARGQAARLGIGIDSLLRLGKRAKSFADSVVTHAPVRLTVGREEKRFDRYGRAPR